MKASNIFQKLKTQGFGTDGSKPAIPGIKTPLSMKDKGDNGKTKEVKAQSIKTDIKAGTRTRYFSEEDQEKYGVPAEVISKITKVKSSPTKKSCSPMKMEDMEMETMVAGPGNPRKAMRKAKKRATKATNVMQRAMNACKRNTRGSGSTYRN